MIHASVLELPSKLWKGWFLLFLPILFLFLVQTLTRRDGVTRYAHQTGASTPDTGRRHAAS
jgi:hypothetical protein